MYIQQTIITKQEVRNKKRDAYTSLEISASLLHVAHRDSETLGILRIYDCAVRSPYVSTENIFRTFFTHSSGHNNTSFLHLQACVAHRQARRTPSSATIKPRAIGHRAFVSFPSRRGQREANDGSPKGGFLYKPLKCAAKVKTKIQMPKY